MNTVEQLFFLARFVKMDLERTREGDWLNVQDDLAHFLEPKDPPEGDVVFDVYQDPESKKYPKQKIVSLQKEARLLLPLFIGGDWATTPTTAFKPEITYELLPGGVLCAHGKFRDMFVQRIINVIANPAEMSKVKQCPECGTIFSRVRRQKYCSGACVDRANKRVWLATPKGKKYLRKLKKKQKRRRK
jgi:hypothetical protein